MKKCPTCDKTFDDNLKFCQTDGTPLVAAEEAAEDPFKTTVAKQDDLPIPADDPFKTMVAGSAPPVEEEPPSTPVAEAQQEEEDEIDPLKTIVSTDFPAFEKEAGPEPPVETAPPAEPEPPVKEEESEDKPPPSPFGQPPEVLPTPPVSSAHAEDSSQTPPDPPKFSEPDLNPPPFGDREEAGSAQPPFEESAPEKPPEAPKPEEPPADFGQSPFGQAENAPIPSPFEESQSSGYQAPLTPMPPYKDAEVEEKKAEALNTPFAEQNAADQQMAQQGWNPPPAPEAGWQNQDIGQNTPFQPPMAGVQGSDQTLAIISLACGILSIPCCGLLTGIPAVIMGFMAKNKAESNPEQYTGRGLALGGIITGAIGTVLSIIVLILQILLGIAGNL